jgi:hypothetical protein
MTAIKITDLTVTLRIGHNYAEHPTLYCYAGYCYIECCYAERLKRTVL